MPFAPLKKAHLLGAKEGKTGGKTENYFSLSGQDYFDEGGKLKSRVGGEKLHTAAAHLFSLPVQVDWYDASLPSTHFQVSLAL